MPWLSWELLFSMLCIDKGSSLNVYLIIYDNYVVIMIMMMSIYVYMYLHMLLFYIVFRDHDLFYANDYINECMYSIV